MVISRIISGGFTALLMSSVVASLYINHTLMEPRYGGHGPVCPVAAGCGLTADPCALKFRWDDKAEGCGAGFGHFFVPTTGDQRLDISTGCSFSDPPIYSIVFEGKASCGTCAADQTMTFYDTDGNSLGDYSFTQGVEGSCFNPGVQIKSYSYIAKY
jgi:hypothetical protein